MPIDVLKSGIAVGVGAVDSALEAYDEKEGRTEMFRKWADIARFLGATVGYGLQVFAPRQARIGEALALSCTPLLVKSVVGTTIGEAVTGKARSGADTFVAKKRMELTAREPVSVPVPPKAPGQVVITSIT